MIRRATNEDISAIEAVFYDAICWMEQNHVPNLWTIANTRWDILSKSYDMMWVSKVSDDTIVGH